MENKLGDFLNIIHMEDIVKKKFKNVYLEKAVNDIEKYLSTNLILKSEDEVELYQM